MNELLFHVVSFCFDCDLVGEIRPRIEIGDGACGCDQRADACVGRNDVIVRAVAADDVPNDHVV